MTSTPKWNRVARWIVGILLGVTLIGSCWYLDFPAIADSPPRELSGAGLGGDSRVYVYSVGGFIDWTYCWRIDAPRSDVERVIKHLDLHPSTTVPNEFWRLPPHYWLRSQDGEMKAYRSTNFTDDSRGSDGPHYFLIHDTTKNQAFVLFKDNF